MYRNYTRFFRTPNGYVSKLILVMKLTTFLLLISLIQVNAASFGQKVTLKAGETTVNNIFKEIRKQTGYSVMLDKANFKTDRKVTANFNNASIQMVMDQVLEGTGFTYVIEDKNIIVEQKEKSLIDRIVDRFAAIDVTGKVLDSDGKPLPGATVAVKGTKISTTTQNDGSFTLKAVSDDAVLVISYMGFEAKEIKAEQNIGSIRLVASTNPLDEVQVIAYGTTTRRLSTGNTTTIKSKDIENQPVANPLLAIQGRVPGLVIIQQTGVSGGGVTVRIQGQNSMQSGNDPFFVIDGMPIDSKLSGLNGGMIFSNSSQTTEGHPLNYLNPTDIESIDILKDADATAIYGSRAANGAILITTKKGKEGKLSLTANLHYGFGQAPYNGFEMLNTRDYLDMRYEAYRNDGLDWRNTNVDAPDLKLWDTTRYTNWRKELIGGTALSQRAQLSLSGGSKNTQYRISGNYNKSTTVFPDSGNGNPAASFSANLNSNSPNNRFKFQWNTNYQYNKNELPKGNFLQAALFLAPNAPEPYNLDGTINWAPDMNGKSTYLLNPFVQLSDIYRNITTNLVSNMIVSYKILEELNLQTNFGFSNLQTEDFVPTSKSSVRPEDRSSTQNQAIYGSRNSLSWIVEPQINYKRTTSIGKVDFLIGTTLNSSVINSKNITGVNYPSDELLKNIFSAASIFSLGSIPDQQNKYLAYFSRLTYNLKDKYVLNLTARRDGSPRFGENKRFSNFYSIGGAWVFSQEKELLRVIPWLSFGKLRASYGVTGNDQIGEYQYIRTYRSYSLPVPYQGISSLQASGLPNPDLVWERVRKISLALDLGFLNDRISLSVNYSRNSSDNQLLSVPLASINGFTSMVRNLDATVENKSFEYQLNSVNIKNSRLEWTTNLNVTVARNKLVRYPNLEKSPYAGIYVVGQPIDIQRLYRFGGVNSSTGMYQQLDKNGNPTDYGQMEDQIFRSLATPFYGGLQNTIKFDNFSFDFFIQFTKQWGLNTKYNNGYVATSPGVFDSFTGASNQPITVLKRWQKPGDNTEIAKFSTMPYNGSEQVSYTDAAWKDASFARLKNLSISWKLPSSINQKVGVQSATLIASGQNLLTFTNYDGPDPETQSLLALPPLRVFTLGINIVL